MSRPVQRPLARADGHLAQGRIHRATGAYRAVLSIDPSELRAHVGLAKCATAKGDPIAALEHYGKALELDPDALSLHVDVAELEAGVGKLDDAVTRLQNLAQVYRLRGEADEAAAIGAVADQLRGSAGGPATPTTPPSRVATMPPPSAPRTAPAARPQTAAPKQSLAQRLRRHSGIAGPKPRPQRPSTIDFEDQETLLYAPA